MSRATPPTTGRELTLEEYLATPETKLRHEVVDGVIVMSPSPNFKHQLLLGRLHLGLIEFVRRAERGTLILAPADLLIRKKPRLRVRQPDLMFVSRERMRPEALEQVAILEVAPDLVVEIVSPSDKPTRWAEKCADYSSIGVPELWRFDPKSECADVFALGDDGYLPEGHYVSTEELRSRVLSGLVLPLSRIFASKRG